jgi:ApaG domain
LLRRASPSDLLQAQQQYFNIEAQVAARRASVWWGVYGSGGGILVNVPSGEEGRTLGVGKDRYLVTRLKRVLVSQGLDNVLDSFSPCLTRQDFAIFKGLWKGDQPLPSSLMAFFLVMGAQKELLDYRSNVHKFAGLLGSFSCYGYFYSMRLVKMAPWLQFSNNTTDKPTVLVGISPGRRLLHIEPCPEDPQGRIILGPNDVVTGQQRTCVGQGGILTLHQYLQHLEAGVYKRVQVMEQSPDSQGIGLFPDAGDTMSCCVTRGIEVRASARWLPSFDDDQDDGINFGCSIRIQMLTKDREFETCQLVSRHWEFMDGNGHVRRVDGPGVVGIQLFAISIR